MELTPFLQRDGSLPLYVQVYEYIKLEIEQGRLPEGTRLPSIRRLSEHLSVSKNTIEAAYQQLVAEGYVGSKAKSGMHVLSQEELSTASQTAPPVEEEREPSTYAYDFQYGDLDLEHFPYRQWKQCLQKALETGGAEVLLYGNRQGDRGLREEIAKHVLQARGVSCLPEQVVICAGTQQAITFLCQLLELAGQPVAMEDPGYDGVRTVLLQQGCLLQPVAIEDDGISMAELSQSAAKAVYITPSHQFPCGAVLPIQKRMKLLQWAYNTNSFIVEDDYDSEFRYQGQPIPALKALDTGERVIYLGTFSKSFLPAARVSYVILPPILLTRYKKHFQNQSQSASPLIQRALYLFMKEGSFSRHVRRMRKLYQAKHRALLTAIEAYMGERVRVIGQRAGLHLLLEVAGGQSGELVRRAETAGVKVYEPKKYWADPDACPPGLVILGFGGLREEDITEGIRILAEAWACVK
ncbi:PLP-dependent aminotransferase family protein [Ectobacillus ponti]|uniref:PLP-dependent aminotransferase family protein n=1 Tax=Ectobacillus ponti TaxID=2961894 RepID=A0AA41X9S9_9BACI|nr:PLP-dependent aminotransferase family protein [Ectobacillus ponti]MCP8971332.1 PLP-dependent aminotransferase family protein [Ectobacillus ponti]